MRTNTSLIVAGAWLVSLMTAVPAQAQFGKGWLERLSGPGPFGGFSVDARLLCLASPPEADRAAIEAALASDSLGSRLTYPLDGSGKVWATGAGCHFLDRDQPRMQIGLEYAALGSKANVLDYSHRPDLSQSDRKVNLRSFMVTADLRVNRVLDVGAALGRGWFSSPDDIFSDFSRAVTQPMRLTTRPLAALSNDKRLDVLVVRFDATKFHGAFTAEDFGARPGTYNEPGEIIWTWSIRVDLGALLWR